MDNLDVFLCKQPEIVGSRFINLRIKTDVLLNFTQDLARDQRLGIDKVENPERYVVDFSGPNLAKEMHVWSVFHYHW